MKSLSNQICKYNKANTFVLKRALYSTNIFKYNYLQICRFITLKTKILNTYHRQLLSLAYQSLLSCSTTLNLLSTHPDTIICPILHLSHCTPLLGSLYQDVSTRKSPHFFFNSWSQIRNIPWRCCITLCSLYTPTENSPQGLDLETWQAIPCHDQLQYVTKQYGFEIKISYRQKLYIHSKYSSVIHVLGCCNFGVNSFSFGSIFCTYFLRQHAPNMS